MINQINWAKAHHQWPIANISVAKTYIQLEAFSKNIFIKTAIFIQIQRLPRLWIKQLAVEFSIDLGDINDVVHEREHALGRDEAPARSFSANKSDQRSTVAADVRQGWSGRKISQTISVANPGAGGGASAGSAKVTLIVEGCAPPEGVARLIERLTKLM